MSTSRPIGSALASGEGLATLTPITISHISRFGNRPFQEHNDPEFGKTGSPCEPCALYSAGKFYSEHHFQFSAIDE